MTVSSSTREIRIQLPPDCASSPALLELTNQIRQALGNKPATLVLDGSAVIRLGSVAIGTCATVQKELEKWEGKLILFNFSIAARSPFEVCRVTRHFNWEDAD